MTRSLQDRAYDILRDRIATGAYPPGTFLSENSLSAELALSRTPLRAAIERLQSEGVLERRPRIGTFVRIIDPEELQEIYDIRLHLETLAAARAASQISADELSCLRALADEMASTAAEIRAAESAGTSAHDSISRLIAADMTFHQVLAWASGNRWIHRILDGMHVLSRFFGLHRHAYSAEVAEQIGAGHAVVVEALARRDAEEAAAALRTHLQTSREQSMSYITPNPRTEHGPVPLQLPESYLEHLVDIPALRKVID